jgi:hypothetical protein
LFDARPFGAGLEPDRRLRHRQRRGIGRGLGPADLAVDGIDAGMLGDQTILRRQLERRVVVVDAGRGGGHVEQIAFIEAR